MKNKENKMNESNDGKIYVPFDEFIYRRIIDMCLSFTNNYQQLNTKYHEIAVRRCENIFEAIMDFSSSCDELPEELRYPAVDKWAEMDQMPTGVDSSVIHPRRALDYIMRVMNELRRQQMLRGRDPQELVRKYGLDQLEKKRQESKEMA